MTRSGQLMMVDIEGRHLDGATADFLQRHAIRAVCLFRKNLGSEAQIQALTAALREVMGPQALIAIDQEGGSVVRATTLPQAPSAMALGAARDPLLARAVGAAVARGLRHLGINWNFAPVLDVNSNPANPVIGERSFGADPDAVAALAGAWMQGSLDEGVACCVKHFPGHGDTHEDSHHALPVVDKPLAALEALELKPFAALAGSAPALMTAHIVYPQLDAERPATLSPVLLTGLLRERLGYRGVVITDALMMEAVRGRWGHGGSAVMALQAGADMVLAQGDRDQQLQTLQALDDAMAGGRLPAAALQASAARLDALAARWPVAPQALAPAQRAADEGLMRQAWARGLSTLGGARPPARGAPLRVFTQGRVDSDGVSEAGVPAATVRALFDGFADVEFVELANLAALDPGRLRDPLRRSVLAGNHRQRYAHAGLAPDLHLLLWNPFQALDVAAPAVIAWGHADGALAALKAWLEGRADAPGIAPVPLETA